MPEPAEADPRLGVKVGVDGTINVLEVARAKNIKRVVFTSSKAAYGEITGEYAPPTCKPVREDYPRQPADLYGSIKVCCEELGRYYRETYGIEFIALRFVSIYGPGKEARQRREMVDPAGRRSIERRCLRGRRGALGLSGLEGVDTEGVDF